MTGPRYRLGQSDRAAMTAEQQRSYDDVAAGPRGYVPRVLEVLLDAPALMTHVQAIGGYLRYGASLPDDVRELATICVAAQLGSGYEWGEHARLADAAGVPAATRAAVLRGGEPDGAAERDIVRFCRTLIAGDAIADDLVAHLADRFGRRGLTELTVLVGYYGLIANGLRVADADAPLPKAEA